ncbi:MAG: virulence protein RhuM/Fic/DOC family protein [bacterium]|nr:virulence protein RhuM/Fic/DOC family protein [bacterium]
MTRKTLKRSVVIYQAKSGAIELRGDFAKETIWATQAQIAEVFGIERSVITKHIRNIYREKELGEKGTSAKIALVQTEGSRTVIRPVDHYNLDLILSVGYRVNSKTATLFRQWATKTLRTHIVDGFTINRSRVVKNYGVFLDAVEKIKFLLPDSGTVDAKSALELIKMFADTWVSIDAYDKDTFPKRGASKKQVRVTADDLIRSLHEFRIELQREGQAGDLFGTERQTGSVTGIVGNIFQSFGGQDMYPTLEEKAAHLLYFMIKNHPFSDGNKRHGAFSFIWFLRKTGLLRTEKMTPTALTALALFIAESDPLHKDRMIGLVLMLLKK